MKTRKSKQFAIALAGSAALFSSAARASTWNSNDLALWSTASEWDNGHVPGIGTEVNASIPQGAPVVDADYTLQQLNVSGGIVSSASSYSLNVGTLFRFSGGSLNGALTVHVSGTGSLSGNLYNGATIDLSTATANVNPAAQIINAGTIKFAAASITFSNNSTTSGRYVAPSGSTLHFDDVTTPGGVLHDFQSGGRIDSGGAVEFGTGTFLVEHGATISAASFSQSGGTSYLRGGGTIQLDGSNASHISLNEATIEPGVNDGDVDTLHFGGNTDIVNTAVMAFDLDASPSAPQPVDKLEVTGSLFVDHPVLVMTLSGGTVADISSNARFVIADTTGHVSGTVDGQDNTGRLPLADMNGDTVGYFDVQYPNMEQIALTNFTPTPEPTFCVTLFGGLMLLFSRRRLS